MNNKEALNVLIQMAQRAMGNAADHDAVVKAYQQLQELVEPKPKKDK